MIYKISKRVQNTTPEHFIHIKNQKTITNRRHRQRTPGNWQRTRPNESRRSTRVYLTIHTSVQQIKIWKITRKKRMGLWNQSTRRHTKGIEYQSLHNDSQKRWSVKPMVGRTTYGRIHHGIKFKICNTNSTMLLHSKEGWISIISTRL